MARGVRVTGRPMAYVAQRPWLLGAKRVWLRQALTEQKERERERESVGSMKPAGP